MRSESEAQRLRKLLRTSSIGLASATLFLGSVGAQAAPVCEPGHECPDADRDGFAACGCPWSGTPCDCNDADPSTYPGAPERCDDVVDHNCSGFAPEACPKKKSCAAGACVPQCVPLADFACANGSVPTPQDEGPCVCVPKDCSIFGCPEGQTCDDTRACVPNCSANVRCPAGQICRGFGCVDPCDEVTCPDGAVCKEGRCTPSCACAPGQSCPAEQACDLSAQVPRCVEPACVGVPCPAASHCKAGSCVDDCDGVVCPPKRVCARVSVNGAPGRARCVDLCSPSPCKGDDTCDWRTGACVPPPPDGRTIAVPEREVLEVTGAGWLCSASAGRGSALTAVACGVAVAFALGRRKSRRR